MGSQRLELEQQNRSSVNITKQEEKILNVQEWMQREGGSMAYARAKYRKGFGSQLVATEDMADQVGADSLGPLHVFALFTPKICKSQNICTTYSLARSLIYHSSPLFFISHRRKSSPFL